MQAKFVIASLNSEADITRAVSMNTARGLPEPDWHSESGSISVCGNGPSLRDLFPIDGPVAALNGAWRTLVNLGVMPDYIIAHDPAPQNVAWFEDAPDEPTYLIASRVHPKVFELLKGKKVKVWQMQDLPEAQTGSKHLIGGGFTIGCHALNLLSLMGYKHFDCYGYDSCYSLDGLHHSTPQSWNLTPPQVYQVADRMFIAEPWMAAQVQEFLKQVQANKYNYTVDVKGDGFLAAALEHNTLEILYDLNFAPGSYDFFCAMVNIENFRSLNGFTRVHVHFKPGKDRGFRPNEIIELSHDYKKLMLNNVARPLLGLFGFIEVGSVSSKARQFQYLSRESLDLYREQKVMAEYRPNEEALKWAEQFSDNPYVITLREADHWPTRNSRVEEWVKFAKTLDRRVIFVRDTAKAHEPIDGFETCPEASIDVHKRLALYARAKMNFAVCTGPMMLAAFTQTIPYIYLLTSAPYPGYSREWQSQAMGLIDQQYPWHDSKTQRVVYADDDFESLYKIWGEMKDAALIAA